MGHTELCQAALPGPNASGTGYLGSTGLQLLAAGVPWGLGMGCGHPLRARAGGTEPAGTQLSPRIHLWEWV